MGAGVTSRCKIDIEYFGVPEPRNQNALYITFETDFIPSLLFNY